MYFICRSYASLHDYEVIPDEETFMVSFVIALVGGADGPGQAGLKHI